MWDEILNCERIVCTFQRATLEGDKYYCDTCIVVFVTRNGYRHHSRTDEHQKKVKKMAV